MFIVAFHNVLRHRPSAFNMLARREWIKGRAFERQVDWLQRHVQIVPLYDLAGAVKEGRSIERACAITFDDGYWGAYSYGATTLEERGLHATFFLITALLHHEEQPAYDFFDRLEALLLLTNKTTFDLGPRFGGTVGLDCDACKLDALRRVARLAKGLPPDDLQLLDATLVERLDVPSGELDVYLSHEAYRMMSWEQAEDLQQRGFDIGSHTRSHAVLSKMPSSALQGEVGGSLNDLRRRLGNRTFPFSYPFGKPEHVSEEAVDAVRAAGYESAVTTVAGPNDEAADPFRLHRVTFKQLRKLVDQP